MGTKLPAALHSLLLLAIAVAGGVILMTLAFYLNLLRWTDIVFYRGLSIIAVVSILVLFASALYAARNQLGTPMAVAAAALSASFNITFLIVFPVTIDRSLTTFVLSQMDLAADRSMTPDEVEYLLTTRYLREWGQVQRRLDEQEASGNVFRTQDGYRLTTQGRRFVRFSQSLAAVYGTDRRFVGEK